LEEWKAVQCTGFTLKGYTVPITDVCPVAGLIGVCTPCFDKLRVTTRDWRERVVLKPDVFEGKPYVTHYTHEAGAPGRVAHTSSWEPPPMVQPVPGVPMYVLQRGFVDDERLGACIAQTWARIPPEAQHALVKMWERPDGEYSGLSKGALRIEALPGWPYRPRAALATCHNRGHAIRLHSPTVDAMPNGPLMTLIAHEVGHAYQDATFPGRKCQGSLEQDVVAVMAEWGFRDADVDDWSLQHCDEKREARLEKWNRKIAARRARVPAKRTKRKQT
jgi:hypothetical protein